MSCSDIKIQFMDYQSVGVPMEVTSVVKWSSKHKIDKKMQKKRFNNRLRRLVSPKTPSMIFTELFKDVPIKVEKRTQMNYVVFIASIEIDGQLYTGESVSKTGAKQNACENVLRAIFTKQISEGRLQDSDDFPWAHLASLAIHNLMNQWAVKPGALNLRGNKVRGVKQLPLNPASYNPVQLLHQMIPGIQFKVVPIGSSYQTQFEVRCELYESLFVGHGSSIKEAKKYCAIEAIKNIWHFDFDLYRMQNE